MELWRRFSLPPPHSSGSDVDTAVLTTGRHFGHAQGTGTIYVLLDDASVTTTAASWTNTRVIVGKGSARSSVSGICKNWLGYATQWYA